jgi:hypothetical protein
MHLLGTDDLTILETVGNVVGVKKYGMLPSSSFHLQIN